MFTIGEFSKITGLTVKTLRFYHEQGLLVPAHIDEQTGYRYYHERQTDTARVISELRALEFPLAEITELLRNYHDDSDIVGHLEQQQQKLATQAEHYRQVEKRLNQIIQHQREVKNIMKTESFEVEEKQIEPLRIAGVRMKGKYSDCGAGFSTIGRRLGRYLGGPCFLLHYDEEYKEDDADFEACFPLRGGSIDKQAEGISIRELPGGQCVSLLHRGPYEYLGRSYEKILKYVKAKQFRIEMPTRELYLKGPGMIFKGNPKKYLTEIQILVRR
jgi:DNA-binding transcriptional MerR regulator